MDSSSSNLTQVVNVTLSVSSSIVVSLCVTQLNKCLLKEEMFTVFDSFSGFEIFLVFFLCET